MYKIIPENICNVNIKDLLIIYGFGEDFYIGRDRYIVFNLKVGELK